LYPAQRAPHALSRISRPRPVHLFGCGGGGLQGDGRDPAQACRHALESARRQCHHCPALLSPECSLRRLLGTPRAEEGRVTLTTLMSCALRGGTESRPVELRTAYNFP